MPDSGLNDRPKDVPIADERPAEFQPSEINKANRWSNGLELSAVGWLAIVHFFLGENDKFESEAMRALVLNPNDPEILADIGQYLTFMGEFERGYNLSSQAQLLNPLHPGWYHFCFARYHYNKRLYEDMLVDVERISMPDFFWTHMLEAAALGQLGRSEAATSLEQVFKLKPDFSAQTELRKWNASSPDFEHIMEGLRKAGL